MRLLVIEDERDLARAIQRGLERQGYAVDIAVDGMSGWELVAINTYDLLVLDLNLPDIDGLDLCQKLRTSHPTLLILMLTARSSLHNRIAGLDCGADDYLIKPFHFDELVARIRALLRRDLRVRAPQLQCRDLKLDPASRVAWLNNQPLTLTRKEFAILEYLLHRPGEVISQEELLEHVWNDEVNPFTNVVRVHINSLRKKLKDDVEAPRYIETIIGSGYRLICDLEQDT